jgi:hypothetical protein
VLIVECWLLIDQGRFYHQSAKSAVTIVNRQSESSIPNQPNQQSTTSIQQFSDA